jgi:hypothetical protein
MANKTSLWVRSGHVRQYTAACFKRHDGGSSKEIAMAHHLMPFTLGVIAPVVVVAWLILQ